MIRPKISDFKVIYGNGVAEMCSCVKQYSKAQDEYIDYIEKNNDDGISLLSTHTPISDLNHEVINSAMNIMSLSDDKSIHEQCEKIINSIRKYNTTLKITND